MFREIHIALPSQDVAAALKFYDSLGFAFRFADAPERPTYAGARRDGVELHFQWHDPAEWSAVERPSLRFLVEDVAALFQEYSDAGLIPEGAAVRETAWGTREFAFFDPDKNGLTFYQDL